MKKIGFFQCPYFPQLSNTAILVAAVLLQLMQKAIQ